jgi:hypothetical protein
MYRLFRICLTLATLMSSLLFPDATLAQTAPAKPADDGRNSDVQIHGSIRTRQEMWDWFGSGEEGRYLFSGNILKLNFKQTNRNVGWMAELAAPFLLGLPSDASQPAPRGALGLGPLYFGANQRQSNAAMVFPRQAYLHLHHLGESERHGIRLGRFDFIDGTEMMPKKRDAGGAEAHPDSAAHTGFLRLDPRGAQFRWRLLHLRHAECQRNRDRRDAHPRRLSGRWLGMETRSRFGYGAYTRQFGSAKAASELRVLSMYYTDWRPVLKTDNRPLATRTLDRERIQLGNYGGHFLHARETGAGTVDFMVWGIGQHGSWGQLSHLAGAIATEVGWQPGGVDALKPWLRAGYSRTSGDGDPTDGKNNTFFQMLPTPRPYARFPFFNMMNNEDIMLSSVLRPHSRLSVSTELHVLNLSTSQDLWYQGGGVFNPWVFGYVGRPSLGERGLANLYDVSVDVKVSKGLAMNFYYGRAQGRGVTRAIYPDQKNAQFGYIEATYTF